MARHHERRQTGGDSRAPGYGAGGRFVGTHENIFLSRSLNSTPPEYNLLGKDAGEEGANSMSHGFSRYALALTFALAVASAQSRPIPQLVKRDGKFRLMVDAKPFLVLGQTAQGDYTGPIVTLPEAGALVKVKLMRY
jgi:hypothetical protein